ncbi:unnamed protein product, partial [Urochloa humidicola]
AGGILDVTGGLLDVLDLVDRPSEGGTVAASPSSPGSSPSSVLYRWREGGSSCPPPARPSGAWTTTPARGGSGVRPLPAAGA